VGEEEDGQLLAEEGAGRSVDFLREMAGTREDGVSVLENWPGGM